MPNVDWTKVDLTTLLLECQRDLDDARAQITQARTENQQYRETLRRVQGYLTMPAAQVQWCEPNERG